MTKTNPRVIIIIIIVILALGLLYKAKAPTKTTEEVVSSGTSTTSVTPGASTTPTKPVPGKPQGVIKGFNSYASGEYNFTIQYPPYVKTRNGFFSFHEIGNNWRLYPNQINQGKQVVSFSIFTTDQGPYSTGKESYPLYYTAEVRIGVSPNTKECYATDQGYTNQKITNVTINGVAFKKFSTTDGATMKYVQAESYRTIHNNMCFVLEQIKNGTTYRDEKMKPGITETALANYYNTGETIIRTFKFTK